MAVTTFGADAPTKDTHLITVGLMGHGTVGRAFLKALDQNAQTVANRVGDVVSVRRILVRDPSRHAEVQDRITTRAADILDDPAIDVVVEVMGGMEPARTYMMEALRRGKTVVTANKEVMADAGADLFQAGAEGGSDLYFEASVGGGMPVIQGLKTGLQSNRVMRITGILNGTTNYMLTRMAQDGLEFPEALREAQVAGYAEADPSSDVEGMDACRKLAILASIGFGSRIRPPRVHMEGIAAVEADDVAYGRQRGWVLKLVGDARHVGDQLDLRVEPVFLPDAHPLAHVDGAFNAMVVEAEPVGRVMFYGPGAGGDPTASAVLGDVMEAARLRLTGARALSCTCYRDVAVLNPDDHQASMYWRLLVVDRPGTLEQVVAEMARRNISLSAVDQRPAGEGRARLVLVTHECRLGDLTEAVRTLTDHPAVARVGRPIPVWGDA